MPCIFPSDTTRRKPASPPDLEQQEVLATLRDPAAIASLRIAHDRNWLSIDAEDVDDLFASCPEHPAYRELERCAEAGGKLGILQFAIFVCFLLLTFILTSFIPRMPPVLFFMWGSLGVVLGLLLRKHPGIMSRYLSADQARKITARPGSV